MHFEDHLSAPRGLGALRDWPHSGAAGGAACGDLIRVAVRLDGDRIAEAGFDAEGCGAARAAGSAAVELVERQPLIGAASVGPDEISQALGGLIPAKRHAAELAADALHRALGAAAPQAHLSPNPRRTLVAMSGGVDSAAAAQLALDAGDEVLAVTLELWADPATDGERSCCSPQAVTGARALAHRMGIPHLTLDLRERFRAEVVNPFIAGYAAGITPNPCVRCNGFVRFDAMLELAEALGAGRLATGHYARIARDERGPLIRAGADPRKDQSYMLAKLDPAQLDRLSFPLGGLTKDAVRALARDAGLPVADKRESQDLCFVAGLGGRAFLQRHGGPSLRRPGEIVDASGAVLGGHDGQHGFTIGQRRGLQLDGAREPLYVLAKDADTNRVTVGPREALATTTVRLSQATLHRPPGEVRQVRLRYHARPLSCEARRIDDATIELRLAEPAEAVAPGQQACLMREDCVVGEGTIA
ncbi:MAG TPA: tRNA 2-thiouridine(34) synthase MnmA [Thermoleophilaceae bacterium]|jgi:tRNA-specific 2-thiouridylase|nr:tRNA 2-thiouridine(34) synthase MnmA [Thermoleophilaceae bacterium]